MKTLTVHLNDTLFASLEQEAEQYQTSVEQIIVQRLEMPTSSAAHETRERTVEAGIEYVIAKNRELLQRLA
ncbi:MAG: hypothetical protein MUF71_13030 [Candidatus Kapabacteria bacterium]|jgi:predicted transcriptional regulator|nr:hypothetical protein [Candidatus Kapabacteria bacterium]